MKGKKNAEKSIVRAGRFHGRCPVKSKQEGKMKTRQIGKSGITASAIALGTWSMGGDAQWGAQDDEASLKAIDRKSVV